MKHLFQSITIANTSLLIMAIFMTSYLVLPFFSEQIKYPLPLQKTPAKPAEDGKSEFLVPSPADYTIISEENLFHPERIIPPEKKVEQELPKPDFILYGTMVSDDISLAFLEDLKSPRNTPGRGKRQVALKKGDIFSGFTLKEIDTDKIVMVRGGENIMVSVVDPQKPKTREIVSIATQKAPVQATQLRQSSPASAQAQKQPLGAKPPVRPSKPTPPGPPLPAVDEKMRQLLQR
jgi:hypothetical protein